MKKDITYHVWPVDQRFEERIGVLEDFAKERGLAPHSRRFPLLTIVVDRYQEIDCDTLEQLAQYMKNHPAYESFRVLLHFVQDKGRIHLDMDFRYHGNYIGVAVSSENLDLVESAHNMIGREFQLSNPAVPVGDRTREKWLNPTVFIAHHFDETGKAYYASLAKFLALLGFDVKEGSTYSTETVPTKVRKLIDRQDILVAVVSGNDTHDWLTAESSYALGKGKHVVPMVEEGTSYKATIHGEDLQQIRFPAGQIEKTFVPLLHEFTSVRVKGIF